jgi:hypothetical protein
MVNKCVEQITVILIIDALSLSLSLFLEVLYLSLFQKNQEVSSSDLETLISSCTLLNYLKSIFQRVKGIL